MFWEYYLGGQFHINLQSNYYRKNHIPILFCMYCYKQAYKGGKKTEKERKKNLIVYVSTVCFPCLVSSKCENYQWKQNLNHFLTDQSCDGMSYPDCRRHSEDWDTQMKHNEAVFQGGNLGAMMWRCDWPALPQGYPQRHWSQVGTLLCPWSLTLWSLI